MHLKLKRVCNEKENLLNYEKVAVSWMSLVRSSLDLATSVHTGEASHYQPSGEFLWEHPSTCDWWTLVDKYLSSLGLCCRWVAKSSPTLSDPTDYSMPARLHFLHYLPPGVCSKSCPLKRYAYSESHLVQLNRWKGGPKKKKLKIERKQYYRFSVLSISHVASFKALPMTGHFASNHSVTHSQQNM